VGTILLGPRKGRFDANGKAVELAGHSVMFPAMGVMLLWIGFFGFNMLGTTDLGLGSTGTELMGRITMNTLLCPSASSITLVVITRLRCNYFHVPMVLNGLLAGLVAVTAGCATMPLWASLLVGVVAGCLYYTMSQLMKWFRVDDVVDGVPIHAGCGMLGLVAAGIFVTKDDASKAGYGGFNNIGEQFLIQILFALYIVAPTAVFCYVLLRVMDFLGLRINGTGIRVPMTVEEQGLDLLYGISTEEQENKTLDTYKPVSGSFRATSSREAVFCVERYTANTPTEDRYHVLVDTHDSLADTSYFGLYDGHLGEHTAVFLDQNMHDYVLQELEKDGSVVQNMHQAFKTVDNEWKNAVKDRFQDGEVHLAMAGSCALVAVFKDGCIHVANTGDSRAVLGSVNMMGELEVEELTMDHNLSNPAEAKLLVHLHQSEKGVITGKDNGKRVKGALKVTRSLGDLYLKDRQFNCLPLPSIFQAKEPFHPPYILNEPQVITRTLEDNDRFLLMASDGLWENVSTEDVALVMYELLAFPDMPLETAPGKLIRLALERAADKHNIAIQELIHKPPQEKRHFHDDITVMIIFLPHGNELQSSFRQSWPEPGGSYHGSYHGNLHSHSPSAHAGSQGFSMNVDTAMDSSNVRPGQRTPSATSSPRHSSASLQEHSPVGGRGGDGLGSVLLQSNSYESLTGAQVRAGRGEKGSSVGGSMHGGPRKGYNISGDEATEPSVGPASNAPGTPGTFSVPIDQNQFNSFHGSATIHGTRDLGNTFANMPQMPNARRSGPHSVVLELSEHSRSSKLGARFSQGRAASIDSNMTEEEKNKLRSSTTDLAGLTITLPERTMRRKTEQESSYQNLAGVL